MAGNSQGETMTKMVYIENECKKNIIDCSQINYICLEKEKNKNGEFTLTAFFKNKSYIDFIGSEEYCLYVFNKLRKKMEKTWWQFWK